jgi:DNA-binding response OmpR family regulator
MMSSIFNEPAPISPRVLVIDDDRATRVLLRKVLTQSGFDVDVATGGNEGMKLALTRQYGAILLDLVMPQPDGAAVLRKIASTAPALLSKIIIITGYPQQTATTEAHATLTKPLDVTEVIRLVRRSTEAS